MNPPRTATVGYLRGSHSPCKTTIRFTSREPISELLEEPLVLRPMGPGLLLQSLEMAQRNLQLLSSWWQISVKETAYDHVWPGLEFNWRVVLGTLIAFVGGALGCVGGIGGGGIFVPMLTLVIGFDQKSSTALSKCMIMGASITSVLYNFSHCSSVINYDLALIFQPALVLGISIGVVFNVIVPNWVVTILLIVLFTGTSVKTLMSAVALWERETSEKMLVKGENQDGCSCVPGESGLENGGYEALEPKLEPAPCKMKWKSIGALGFVWIAFLILQILKNYTDTCSTSYWTFNLLQVPVAGLVFFSKAFSLCMRRIDDEELDPGMKWTVLRLFVCAIAGLLAGIVGGLLGLGGGFILGPLFLELGVAPEVASATTTFVMLFSSSMSVIEYYLLHRFPVPFALYLVAVNAAAGFWAQIMLRRVIAMSGRTSVIVFILSFIILISAVCLGSYGIRDSILKLQNHEYMGFLDLCTWG